MPILNSCTIFDIKFESSYYVCYDYLILYSNRAIIWHYCLIDVNVWYVWYQINGEKVNNQNNKKNWQKGISDRFLSISDWFFGRRYPFMTSEKNNSDKKKLVAEKVSATGWRHSATGDVIGWVSATMLSATGVSATGIDFQRPEWVSETGAFTFSYRNSGRWKSNML